MTDEEIKKILNQIIKRNGITFFGYNSKEIGNTAIKEALNLIDKLQKELDNRIPREIVENKLKELEEKDYVLSSRESEISILKDILNKE